MLREKERERERERVRVCVRERGREPGGSWVCLPVLKAFLQVVYVERESVCMCVRE